MSAVEAYRVDVKDRGLFGFSLQDGQKSTSIVIVGRHSDGSIAGCVQVASGSYF